MLSVAHNGERNLNFLDYVDSIADESLRAFGGGGRIFAPFVHGQHSSGVFFRQLLITYFYYLSKTIKLLI